MPKSRHTEAHDDRIMMVNHNVMNVMAIFSICIRSSRCPRNIGNLSKSTSLAGGMRYQTSDVRSLLKPRSDMQTVVAP